MRKAGLREKPSYDELINEIDIDQLVRYPDRRALRAVNSPYLAELFNSDTIDLEDQAQLRQKHEDVERFLRGGGGGGPPPGPPPGPGPGPVPAPAPAPPSGIGAAAATANVLRAIYHGAANIIGASNPTQSITDGGEDDDNQSFYSLANSAGHLPQNNPGIMDVDELTLTQYVDANGRVVYPAGNPSDNFAIENNGQPQPTQNDDFWLSDEGPDTSNTASQLALVLQNSGTQNFNIGTPRFQEGGASGSGSRPIDRLAHVEDREQEADFMYGVRREPKKKKSKKEPSPLKPTPLKKAGVPPKKKENIPTSQMGTDKEYGNKNMFMSKSRGYLVDQLSLRGVRLKKEQLRTKGQGAMSKKELVDLILAKDGLVKV